MDPATLRALLAAIKTGELDVEAGVEQLAQLPFRDLEHTRFDTHRAVRLGHAEVIFGAGKTEFELLDIIAEARKHHAQLLVTRVPEHAEHALRTLPGARFHERSRALTFGQRDAGPAASPEIAVVSAGTSDGAVAEEAWVTAQMLGLECLWLKDVGVAGLHRLLATLEELRSVQALVVVAGMEGALPSVVAGLVECPVIAVPTSVGYGASYGGLAALLAMLNSCAPGVSVVNIDNGFGGAYAARRMVPHRNA